MQTEIDLVAFGPEHIESAVALSQAQSWPHRAEDWRMVLDLSTGVVAINGDENLVGTILMTPYGQDSATINMVIVDKSMRGQGLGKRLMEKAISLAGNRPLRLISTDEGRPLYEKMGFVASGSIVQHQGNVSAVSTSEAVDLATSEDLKGVRELDREAYGADRTALISSLAECGTFAVIRKGGRIEAYAAIRAFGRGEVIGPVIAPDKEAAKALIAFFAAARPGAFLRIDTGSETGLGDWLNDIGLRHAGGGVVMLRPLIADAGHARRKVYAIANQALG